jgi:transcriptional regulator with PAS, ATPase and Fis domain
MSTAHALMTRVGDDFMIEDMGSRNGTFVNGKSIRKVLLQDGDLLELGRSFFLYRASVPCPEGVTDVEGPLATSCDLPTLIPSLATELSLLEKIACSNVPVMLLGESGTGKEILARGIHQRSGRPGPFVAVNCGALPETLVQSELFGFRRGAFSGALDNHPGLVRTADMGTLFLDEIAELPRSTQASLLRVLQEGEVLAIGGTRPVKVDFRIIAATHRDLEQLTFQGQFRADLLTRLSGYIARLPALRDRREDLGMLISQLLRRACDNGNTLRLSNEAARALFAYHWPRNVRELEQALRAAVVLADDTIELADLPEAVRTAVPYESSPVQPVTVARRPRSRLVAQDALTELLWQHRGNLSAVARALGRDRVQIRRWIRHYRLDLTKFYR